MTRIVNAVAAGRILNPKTARSQILGGVAFGIGMALTEESMLDHRLGRFINHNIAEYHVPVLADMPDIEVIFVEEHDSVIPLGVKGVGEIGTVGTAAAIGNAVYHATGVRVRDLPITSISSLHGHDHRPPNAVSRPDNGEPIRGTLARLNHPGDTPCSNAADPDISPQSKLPT